MPVPVCAWPMTSALRAAAGSPAPGSGWATRSRRRGGPGGSARTARGRQKSSFRPVRLALRGANSRVARRYAACALCRSPSSDPSPLTPSRPSRASATACSAARPSTSRSRPRSSPRPASSGPSGDDFSEAEYAVLHNRGVDHRRRRARPRRQDVLLGGPLRARRQHPPHAADRPQRLRDFEPKLERGLAQRGRAVPREHPARPPARGARAVHRRALRRPWTR